MARSTSRAHIRQLCISTRGELLHARLSPQALVVRPLLVSPREAGKTFPQGQARLKLPAAQACRVKPGNGPSKPSEAWRRPGESSEAWTPQPVAGLAAPVVCCNESGTLARSVHRQLVSTELRVPPLIASGALSPSWRTDPLPVRPGVVQVPTCWLRPCPAPTVGFPA